MARLGAAEAPPQVHPLPRPLLQGPSDFLPIASIIGVLGLQGQVRARVLAPSPADESVLMHCRQAWLHHPRLGWWQPILEDIRAQGQDLRIRFEDFTSRDQVSQLLGAEIGLPRADLPPPDENETYWIDLLGCDVVNTSGHPLGRVERLETNGPQDWLIIGPHWVPYVDRHVLSVDLASRRILVDWEEDWT